MATKQLKDQTINVRATDKTKATLITLTKKLNLNQADVIALALDQLIKSTLNK
jgi:antitoxin component of RelBE/YafQ-DinJ toxin-antitoxin module